MEVGNGFLFFKPTQVTVVMRSIQTTTKQIL